MRKKEKEKKRKKKKRKEKEKGERNRKINKRGLFYLFFCSFPLFPFLFPLIQHSLHLPSPPLQFLFQSAQSPHLPILFLSAPQKKSRSPPSTTSPSTTTLFPLFINHPPPPPLLRNPFPHLLPPPSKVV